MAKNKVILSVPFIENGKKVEIRYGRDFKINDMVNRGQVIAKGCRKGDYYIVGQAFCKEARITRIIPGTPKGTLHKTPLKDCDKFKLVDLLFIETHSKEEIHQALLESGWELLETKNPV